MSDCTSIAEIISAAGLRLQSLAAGHTEHIICPRCKGGRSRETCLSVTIDADGDGATWVCHRGSCGWKDGARVHGAPAPQVRGRTVQPPPEHSVEAQTNRPDWLYEFFSARNIGARTVHELGIYATTRRFPDPVRESPAIVFPYLYRGEVVNRKYRPFPAKNPMLQERDALPTLFNVDRLGDDPEQIVFVEGECDVVALFECGIKHAVSLKDGAPASLKAEIDPDAKRFAALKTHADLLAKAKRVVLAGDADGPGLALREELARRLGRHRCVLVAWPADCKDASDALRLHGPEAVLAAMKAAEPYPIDGIQSIRAGSLLELRRLPPPSTMTTGTRATDAILKLPTEGRLIIVTGFPGSGKSSWVRHVMVHTCANHERKWAVFSPEMQPWTLFASECAECWSGKPFWPTGSIPSMTDDEIRDAETWLGDRVQMIVCDAENSAPTIDWVLDRAKVTVLRDGTTDLLVDPWNEIDHTRPAGVSETEHIGRSLQRLKAFGLRHGCNVWLIAHPAKPQPLKNGEAKGGAPGPYDISGSANFFNRCDIGITVHSPHADAAEVHLWKSRFVKRWGKRGSVAALDFNLVVGRYSTPVAALSVAGQSWHDR